MFKYLRRFGIVVVLALTGCAASPVDTARPERNSPGRDIAVYRPRMEGSGTVPEYPRIEEPTGVVTLRHALSLALTNNPELAAFAWEVRASEARTLQAGLLANPAVKVEANELGSPGGGSSIEPGGTTLVLSQLVELGGKRAKRKVMTRLEGTLATWEYENRRLEVFAETTKAFVDVLATQKRVVLTERTFRVVERTLVLVGGRVKSRKAPALEKRKAQVAFSTRRIALERARRELRASRRLLAAKWGSTAPAFTRVEGEFESIREIPALDQVLALASRSPDMARWRTEIELSQAAVELEKAGRVPDVTVSAGVQQSSETDDQTFIVGLSVPLPFFNRNQGGVAEARHKRSKAIEKGRATDVRVRTALSHVHETLSSSYSEAVALKDEVLPAAQQAFDDARRACRQGKLEYLGVLDAQRTLLEARAQQIDALASYHKAVADAERLIGQRLGTASPQDNGAERENYTDGQDDRADPQS